MVMSIIQFFTLTNRLLGALSTQSTVLILKEGSKVYEAHWKIKWRTTEIFDFNQSLAPPPPVLPTTGVLSERKYKMPKKPKTTVIDLPLDATQDQIENSKGPVRIVIVSDTHNYSHKFIGFLILTKGYICQKETSLSMLVILQSEVQRKSWNNLETGYKLLTINIKSVCKPI